MATTLNVGDQVTIGGVTYTVGAQLLPVSGSPTPGPNPQPPTPTPLPAGFRCFPAEDAWNQEVSGLPVAADSAAMIAAIGAANPVHPDFGAPFNGRPNGIPFNVIDSAKLSPVPITFQISGESDAGPYPIPASPAIEAESDAHLLLIDPAALRLWEVDAAAGPPWTGFSGAIWDLSKPNAGQRPAGWTSADGAGLPIFPGLVRFAEVAAGTISHALRFTAPHTRRAYLSPANHWASQSTDPGLPPMGLRVRLKASVDTSGFSAPAQVICAALKKYGLILADNGSPWFIQGEPNDQWDDALLADLKQLHGSDLEVVDTGAALTADGATPAPHPTPPPPPGPTPAPSPGVIWKIQRANDPTFTPITTAAPGTQVIITGHGFGPAGVVGVGGGMWLTTSWTDGVIVATVPATISVVTGPLIVTPIIGPPVSSTFMFTIN